MRVFLVLLLVPSLALGDVIVTKDGQSHSGRILDKTAEGYLFREDNGVTWVVGFTDVDDVQKGDAPVAQPSTTPSAAGPDRRVSLLLEWNRVREERDNQTLGMPIVGIVVGTLGLVAGVSGLANATYGIPDNTRAAYALLAGGGGGLLLLGLTLAIVRISRRAGLDEKMVGLRKEAAALGFLLPE